MEIKLATKSPELIKTDALILLFTKESLKRIKQRTKLEKAISRVVKTKEFSGHKDDLLKLSGHSMSANKVILLGLGEEKELTLEILRRTISNAIKPLSAKDCVISLVNIKLLAKDKIKSAVESTTLSAYKFDKYKTYDKKNPKVELKKVTLVIDGTPAKYKDLVKETQTLCNNTNFVRFLVNENADEINPIYMTNQAKKLASKYKRMSIRVLNERDISKQKLNLIKAVGQGSRFPQRLVILEYKGNPSSKDRVALVGKGITFDTGGINLKPTMESLLTMRMDMAGAGTVLGTMKACAELKIKQNVIGVLPLVENAIGSRSYKPGDIVKSYSGKTVEVMHTDAEGRLILADALAYVNKNYKPSKIIDLATLTGAALVIFGEHICPIVSNNDSLPKQLKEASELTGEKVWHLPLIDEYKNEMKSDTADLRNINKTKSHAGTITAAAFLENFVGKTPWAHLDIAGTAWSTPGHYYNSKGATGFGVRLLIEFLKNS